jgi:hypothetical protein
MMGWSAATAIRTAKRYGQTESYPETGLWEAPESPSKMPTKVNSLWPNPGLLIALHSPYALLKTGQRMCPPEKS